MSESFDAIVKVDAEHVMATYPRLPVVFVRGEEALRGLVIAAAKEPRARARGAGAEEQEQVR